MENSRVPGSGFHHMALKVRDYDRSLRFYTEGLGMTLTKSFMTGPAQEVRTCMLDMGGGACLELFADAPEGAGFGDHWLHIALCTTDCDTAYASAMAAGATEDRPPFDAVLSSQPPTPARIAFVRGPDGERIEFFQAL